MGSDRGEQIPVGLARVQEDPDPVEAEPSVTLSASP